MAKSTTTEPAPLMVALTGFSNGYKVIPDGATLRADDPIVLANPKRFVRADLPSGEIEHARRLHRAAVLARGPGRAEEEAGQREAARDRAERGREARKKVTRSGFFGVRDWPTKTYTIGQAFVD